MACKAFSSPQTPQAADQDHKIELAEIFRLHGPEYLSKFGDRILPSHLRAMEDIVHCRTEYFGGKVYFCHDCDEVHYSYHSCKNRFCPKCGHHQTQEWLDNQRALLLPVTYFMATFTLHDHLRRQARSHQNLFYDLMFRTSSAALQELAWDPQFVGGRIGMTGVLQTWTRDLGVLHPHIHYLVPGGGVSADGKTWLPARKTFLMPKWALSKIFRGKFRDELKKTAPELFDAIPAQTWAQKWVVHIKAVGAGEKALTYLAPYLFHGPISNKRLITLENGRVTFLYQPSKTTQWKTKTVAAQAFIARFLQHVLPHRFVRVRSYGLLNPGKRDWLDRARDLLGANHPPASTPKALPETPPDTPDDPGLMESELIQPPQGDPMVLPSYSEVQTLPLPSQESQEPKLSISTPEKPVQSGGFSPPPDEPTAEKPKTINCPKCGQPMQWITDVLPNKNTNLFRARSP